MNKEQKLLDTNMMRAYYVQAQLFSHKHKTKKPQPFVRYLVVGLILLMLASCTKEVSKPIELRPPSRPEVMTVQAIVDRVTYSQCCNLTGWQFNFRIPSKVNADIRVYYEFKQKNDLSVWKLYTTIPANNIGINQHTMLEVRGDIEYIRLVKVEGTNRKFNLLHVK